MPKHIVIVAINILGASVAYCTEYNPTNFKITVKQEKCAGKRSINLPMSKHLFFGSELDYAIKVDMKYPPLYILVDNEKKYVKRIKFELYKETELDSYSFTYDVDILRDSFFQSSGFIIMNWDVLIPERKVNAILAKTPQLNERNPPLHGWELPHLSFVTDEKNLQTLKSFIELFNIVGVKLIYDSKDLDAKYPSWLSAITWRRKILGL